MGQNTITVKLTVQDDGSVTLKQFGSNTEQAMNKASSSTAKANVSFATLKSSYLEMTAKAATAYIAIQKAMEYMDKGVKAEQAEASFRTLAAQAGESADAIISAMKKATNETIDDSDMMQKAAKAMMMGFDGEQITRMAEAARIAARTTGEDVGQTFENIANAISTNMPRALKQYGLITKEQMSMVEKAMQEGVEGVDLYSIAIGNMIEQQEKFGPLIENDAERLQQYRAKIDDVQESFGTILTRLSGFSINVISKITEPLMAMAASASLFDGAPMLSYYESLAGIADETEVLADANRAAAEAEKRRNAESIKASQSLMAQRKLELDTLKTLNKEYFSSQEENIKMWTAIQQAAGADEYQIALETIQKREELNIEFYDRAKQEIEAEAALRSKAEREKISDAAYAAQKIQALDQETANKARNLTQERVKASIAAANNDIKYLQSRLSEYQTYYESLKAQMDKNIEDEKKHLDQLKALRQQEIDVDKSTAALIAGIKGSTSSNSLSSYDAQRSSLNSQYFSAMNLGGQDQIKALEDYKNAVAALQAQFSKGIAGDKNIFGNTTEILSAAQVAGDAISDIERATQNQKNTLADLEAQTQSQIETDQLWGMTIQTEMAAAQNEMQTLFNLIADLSAQIAAMEKTVTLAGVDNVSSVVDGIIAKINELHTLAAQPCAINISGTSVISSGLSLNSEGFTEIPFALSTSDSVIEQYAEGTDYVPKTGLYQLHEGEAVIPAAENKAGSRSLTIGELNINIPESAAPQSAADWRNITRSYILPELKKVMQQ